MDRISRAGKPPKGSKGKRKGESFTSRKGEVTVTSYESGVYEKEEILAMLGKQL